THGPRKSFPCEDCAYVTTSNYNLKKHRRVHTGEKPYACHTCPFRTVSNSNLKKHLRIHTGEKPFKSVYIRILSFFLYLNHFQITPGGVGTLQCMKRIWLKKKNFPRSLDSTCYLIYLM
ncbi:UNVERIFIED_CONTAM: hypothetical protein GTU68_022558, partial [Idotea baltica]|nr:hypothetical protein [Idotea baltica]